MVEESSAAAAITAKKRRLDIDFDDLLDRDDAVTAVPELLVVKSSSAPGCCDDRSGEQQSAAKQEEKLHSVSSSDEYKLLSNAELDQKIRRVSQTLTGFRMKLKDKGVKLRANLQALMDEKERRSSSSREDAHEWNKPAHSESTMHGRAPDDLKQDAPSIPQSQFASGLIRRMENNKDSLICNSFGPELQFRAQADIRNGRKKVQSARKVTKKCSLPFTGRKKTDSAITEGISPSYTGRKKTNSTITEGISTSDTNSGIHFHRSDVGRLSNSVAEEKVVLLDEAESEDEEHAETGDDAALRKSRIYFPSCDDPECVEIQYKDLQCLAPRKYLTSTIMNFYIRYLQVPSCPVKGDRKDYYFFNTYFYKKLQEALLLLGVEREAFFIKFRRWWKGVNIFEKAYIFLPIHENHHWSLTIICTPDEADESGPIILHLDSLGYHQSKPIFNNLKSLLELEWNYLNEEDLPSVPMTDRVWQNLPKFIEEKVIPVPQQGNVSDCGLFVLFFMERFIVEAPQRLKKQDLAMFGKGWFKPEQASSLRGKIRKILKKEFCKDLNVQQP